MYDYGLSVLSHYGLTASGTMRVRGALLCHTEQGDKLISEFGTAAEKLEQRYLLQCRITESGLLRCDQILRNEDGALATRGDDGGTYIVRNWYPGRECETGNSEDLIRASDALARLHTAAHLPVKMEYRRESIVEECIRHNVEIRKIRKYLQTKKKKNEFEKLLLASAGPYLEQGERAAAEMKASSYEKLRQRADEEGAVCHGEFSQHNILLENGRGETAVNFDKWNFDLQVADLGYFMRKILEKHGWFDCVYDWYVAKVQQRVAVFLATFVDLLFVEMLCVRGSGVVCAVVGHGVKKLHACSCNSQVKWLVFGAVLLIALVFAS